MSDEERAEAIADGQLRTIQISTIKEVTTLLMI